MVFNRSHKIKLYPTKEQEAKLAQQAGLARFVYNWAIDQNEKDYQEYKEGKREKAPSFYDLSREFTQYKKNNAPEWLSEAISQTSHHVIEDCSNAYKNFFTKKSKYPKYHKKGIKDIFYISNQSAKIVDKFFKCSKIGYVKLAEKPRYTGKIMSYTISKDKGEWFVSINYELEEEDPRPVCSNLESVVGVDVGIKNSITLSTGEQYNIRDTKKLENRIKYQQRYLSRSKKDSKNHIKRLTKLHSTRRKLQNQVKDDIHKATTAICKNHGIVVIENLNVTSMVKTAKGKAMRRNLNNARMNEIHRQLQYKSQKCVKVDRFFASSQICSNCGSKQKMPLKERTYVCHSCGVFLDRDINAAKNIRNQYLSGQGMSIVCC